MMMAPTVHSQTTSGGGSNQQMPMSCFVPCFIMPHHQGGAPPANQMMQQQPNVGDANGGQQPQGVAALYQQQQGGVGMPHPTAGFATYPTMHPQSQAQDGGMDGQQHAQGQRFNGMSPPMPGHVFLANGSHGHPSPVGMMMPVPMQSKMDQSGKNDYQAPNPMSMRQTMQGVNLPRPVNYDGDDTKRTAVRMRGLPYDASARDVMQFFTGLSVDENSVVFMPNKRKSSAAPGAPVKRGWGEAWVFFPDEAQAAAAMERRGQHVGARWIELKQFTIADSETEIWRAYANSGAFDNQPNNHVGMDANYPLATTPAPYQDFNGARGGSTPPLRMNGPPSHNAGLHHQALHPLPLNTVAFGGGNAGGLGKGRMGNVNKWHANISVVPHTQSNNGSPDNGQPNNHLGFHGRGVGGRGAGRGNNNINMNGNMRASGYGMQQGSRGINGNVSSPEGGEWDVAQPQQQHLHQPARLQSVVQPPPKIQTQVPPPQQSSPQQSSPQPPQSPLPSQHLLGSPCIGSPQTSPAMQPQLHSQSTPLPLRTLRGTRVVLVDDDGLVVPSTPATAPATAPAAVLHSTDPDAGFASLIAHDFKGKQPEWVQQWRNSESSEAPATVSSTLRDGTPEER